MPVEKKTHNNLTDDQSVDIFLDRLIQIVLMQVERESETLHSELQTHEKRQSADPLNKTSAANAGEQITARPNA